MTRCTVSVAGYFWDIAREALQPLLCALVSEWLIVSIICPASHHKHPAGKTGLQQTGPGWLFLRFYESRLDGEVEEWILSVCTVSMLVRYFASVLLFVVRGLQASHPTALFLREWAISIWTTTANQTKPHDHAQICCLEHFLPFFRLIYLCYLTLALTLAICNSCTLGISTYTMK